MGPPPVNIDRAELNGAKMPPEIFDVEFVKKKGWLKYGCFNHVKWKESDLAKHDMEGIDLSHSDLSGSNLEGSNMFSAILCSVNFTKCNLKGVNFERGKLN